MGDDYLRRNKGWGRLFKGNEGLGDDYSRAMRDREGLFNGKRCGFIVLQKGFTFHRWTNIKLSHFHT